MTRFETWAVVYVFPMDLGSGARMLKAALQIIWKNHSVMQARKQKMREKGSASVVWIRVRGHIR